MLLFLDDGARHRIHPERALRGVVTGHRDRLVGFAGDSPLHRACGDLGVGVVVEQRRVLDRLDQLAVRVVADVLAEPVGGQSVDVFLAVVVGVERLLRDRVEDGIGPLLGVEREAVGQSLVRQRDVGRRLVVVDAPRLLHGAAGIALTGHRLRRLTVDRDGVDQREQQTFVLLLVGAAQRAADLKRHDIRVGRRLDGDLLLQGQRHVAVDDELLAVERRRVEGRSGAVTDQRGVQVERNLGDLAVGIGRQQQRGNQQRSAQPHDPARRNTQRHCAVQTVPSILLLSPACVPRGHSTAGAPQTRSTLTAQVKFDVYSECIRPWPRTTRIQRLSPHPAHLSS